MKRLWYWLGQNHQSIQAMAAIFAGVLALGTIVGVKWQIDAAARLQKEQSARDIYREYLNVSMSRPEFVKPDYCAITTSAQFGAYEAYISYMLYTAEQVFALGDGWDEVMRAEMEQHGAYLCSPDYHAQSFDPEVQSLVDRIRSKQCKMTKPCAE